MMRFDVVWSVFLFVCWLMMVVLFVVVEDWLGFLGL